MKFITKKQENEYHNKLLDIIDEISITKKYNIVGSYSYNGVLFPSDIDLNESVKIKNDKQIKTFIKKLLTILLKLSTNENIFFIDFKYGVDDRTDESLHWTYDEILEGKKIYGNKTKTFEEGLFEGTIKLDIIYRINYGEFLEVSIIYLINPEKQNILHQLKNDIIEYRHNGRAFKCLKRAFSYYSILKNTNKMYILVKLFNSDISLLNKTSSEITILISLLEVYPHRISLDEIKYTIQNLKYYLTCIFRFKISNSYYKKLDEICEMKNSKNIIINLNKINDKLKKTLQEQTIVWLHYNPNILKGII